MSSVIVLPIPPVDLRLTAELVRPLESILHVPVFLAETTSIDRARAFSSDRHQYNSTMLISAMLEQFSVTHEKVLGVTGVDLFVPVLTYVIGEAQLDGSAAIVSTYRLDDSVYGLPPNRRLMQERLVKEALHELGHTFGLIHCAEPLCVMHSSSSVEEIDVKGERFCGVCENIMNGRTRVKPWTT